MIKVAFYGTKAYDKQFFEQHADERLAFHFHDFNLNEITAPLAEGCDAVCLFVNDHADRSTLRILVDMNVGLVALRCAGFNNVDLEAARELRLPVVRVPGYSPHAIAEYTLGLLLTLNRKIHRAYNRVRDQNFSLEGMVGSEIHRKTIGVIGTGRIGKLVAQVFRGLQTDVLAYDTHPDEEWAASHGVTYLPLEQLLGRADVVTLHAPLMLETYHTINAFTISKMKPGAYLINTSRGALVDTHALIEALKSGHLGGVALDVYEEEDGVFFSDLSQEILPDDDLSRLLGFPNVLVTSHQAFLTREALHAIAATTVRNLLCLETGEPFPTENVLCCDTDSRSAP
ncbi:MAG: 2-hydroxyacid dehydrogenase [Candidatus Lernaella stagnicola]|nr:2-hydroxyacid dehydrogenase [Candidatus Lernaella stagnicola]